MLNDDEYYDNDNSNDNDCGNDNDNGYGNERWIIYLFIRLKFIA